MPTNDILAKTTILLAEDEYYLADDMRVILEDAGATVLGPFATIEKASAQAKDPNLDCAVLDINLRGELSFDLSYALLKRDVPVVFVSGYDASIVPDDLKEVPRMTKPIGREAFLRCVANVAGRPSR